MQLFHATDDMSQHSSEPKIRPSIYNSYIFCPDLFPSFSLLTALRESNSLAEFQMPKAQPPGLLRAFPFYLPTVKTPTTCLNSCFMPKEIINPYQIEIKQRFSDFLQLHVYKGIVFKIIFKLHHNNLTILIDTTLIYVCQKEHQPYTKLVIFRLTLFFKDNFLRKSIIQRKKNTK